LRQGKHNKLDTYISRFAVLELVYSAVPVNTVSVVSYVTGLYIQGVLGKISLANASAGSVL